MSADTQTITALDIQIIADSKQAIASLESLHSTLSKLKSVTKGGLGLTSVAKQLGSLNASLSELSHSKAEKLKRTAEGLDALSKVKFSGTTATHVREIVNSLSNLGNVDLNSLYRVKDALSAMGKTGKSGLGTHIKHLKDLPNVLVGLQSINTSNIASGIRDIVNALAPLAQMGKSNLGATLNQLKKLPEVFDGLKKINMSAFKAQIVAIVNVLKPLANEMDKIGRGFASFPSKLNKVANSSNRFMTSAKGLSKLSSVINFGGMVIGANMLSRALASCINKSNQYIESMNLFNVSMGHYADEAREYANIVYEVMGINPAEWARNQGIFMTLATGFGVAGDNAYIMSKNLTQLGYDLSSFFNIGTQEAFQKLQSGIAGELEPLRRLGYDLSNARLQEEAHRLGITKKVSAMTQAEKAELRYHTIMTQVTHVQQDMARTLDSPANQLRILKANLEMAAVSIGNIFLPALQKILPYAIAVAQVIRSVADAIAALFGFELPDFSEALQQGSVSAGGVADELGNAAKKAKEIKNAMIGIDELNVISPKDDAGGGGGANVGGSGLGIKPIEYDFLGEAKNKVNEIIERFKAWAGITEEIDTWSEFFHTKLGRILTLVGAIGVGLLAWKLSKTLFSGLELLKTMMKSGISVPLVIGLGAGSIALEIAGLGDILANGITTSNVGQSVAGALGLTIATALLGGKFLQPIVTALTTTFGNPAVFMTLSTGMASALLGGGLGAIVAGLPAFVVGVKNSLNEGLSKLSVFLTEFGAGLVGLGAGAIGGALGLWAVPLGLAVGGIVGLVIGGLTSLGIWLYQHWEEVSAWAIASIDKLQSWCTDKWNAIIEFFHSGIERVAEIVHSIGDWFNTLATWIGTALGTGLRYVREWCAETLSTFWNNVTLIVKTVYDKFSQLPDKIKNAIWGAIERVKTWASNMKTTFQTNVTNIIEAVRTWFSETPDKIYKAIITAVDKVVEWAKDMKQIITEEIPKVITQFVDYFAEIPTKLFNLGKDICEGFIDGIRDAWHWVTDGLGDMVDNVVDCFTDGLDIHSPSRVFRSLGGYVVEGFNLGIHDMISTSVSEMQYWVDQIQNAASADSFAIDTSAMANDISAMDRTINHQLDRSYNMTTNINKEKTGTDRSEAYLATACQLLEVIAGKDLTIDGRVLNEQLNSLNKRNGYRLRTT